MMVENPDLANNRKIKGPHHLSPWVSSTKLPPASQCRLFILLKLFILTEANGFLLLCPLKGWSEDDTKICQNWDVWDRYSHSSLRYKSMSGLTCLSGMLIMKGDCDRQNIAKALKWNCYVKKTIIIQLPTKSHGSQHIFHQIWCQTHGDTLILTRTL